VEQRVTLSVRHSRLEHAMLAASTALLAGLPLSVELWPSQDGPNHIAVVHIFRSLAAPDSPFASHFVRGQLTPSPYVLHYWALWVLGRWVDLTVADRILTSGIIAAIPLATLCLLRRVAPEREGNAALIPPLATGFLLLMGFGNFLLGLVFALLALAFALPQVDEPGVPPTRRARFAVAAVALCLAMLAHPLAAAFVGVVWAAFEGPRLRRVESWRRMASTALPAAVVALMPFVLRPAPLSKLEPAFVVNDPWVRLRDLLWTQQWALSRYELPFRLIAMWLLLGCAACAAFRAGLRGTARDAGLARALAVVAVLCVLGPTSLQAGINNYIDTRLALLGVLFSAALANLPAAIDRPLVRSGIGLTLSAAVAAVQYGAVQGPSRQLATYAASAVAVPRGATVAPLDFSNRAGTNFRPFANASGLLVIAADAVSPHVFADSPTIDAGRFRPLRFRRPSGKDFLPKLSGTFARDWASHSDQLRFLADYPLAWRAVGDGMMETAAQYDRVVMIAPPEPFLTLCHTLLVEAWHHGDVWVFQPRAGPAIDPAGPGEAR
jgi:hypothetical protein